MEKEYDKKVLQAVASALQKINGLEAAESGASSLDEVEPEKIVKRQPTRRVKEKKNENEKEKDKGKEKEQSGHGEANGVAQTVEVLATQDLPVENVREVTVPPDSSSSAVEMQRSPTLVRNRTT